MALAGREWPVSTGSGHDDPPCRAAMGRWQREALTEGLWREVAAPPPLASRAVPLPTASPQGGSAMADHHPKADVPRRESVRSEEHTSELQSLMRISYAVFCLKTKNTNIHNHI